MKPHAVGILPAISGRRGALGFRFLARSGVVVMAVVLIGSVLSTQPASAASSSGSVTLRPGQAKYTATRSTFRDGSAGVSYRVPRTKPGSARLGVELRAQGSGSKRQAYRSSVQVSSRGVLTVAISRVSRGKERYRITRRVPGLVRPGQTVRIEGEAGGATRVTVRARAWVVGTATPRWQVKTTDISSSRVKTSGKARGRVNVSKRAPKAVRVPYLNLTTRSAVSRSSVAAQPVARKPSASTVGVPAGTKLRRHVGNITITKPGTRLDRMDIYGFVTVKAKNVKITRSIVRGGRATFNQGLVTNYGYRNLIIEDSLLLARQPSVFLDGIKGSDFTARRVHVIGNVDSIKIHGNNVRIQDSLLENTVYYARDPSQGGGATHNDGIQILNGRNITISGNTVRGHRNFAILGAANRGNVSNLVIQRNWVDGGHCTLKLQTLRSWDLTATVADNKFGPNRAVKYCPFQSEPKVRLRAVNNVYEATGRPVPILRKKY